MRSKSAPVFSFPRAELKRGALADVDPNVPGPGQYRPNFAENGPKITIGEKSRAPEREVFDVPFYCPPDADSRRIPISVARRVQKGSEQDKSSGPGPGQYAPSETQTTPAAPAFSLRSRHSQPENRAESPGPGAYALPSRRMHLQTISERYPDDRQLQNGAGGPGPGDYDLKADPGQKTAPSFSLRSRQRDAGAETAGPGPAAYSPNKKLTSRSAPMYSLSGRWKERDPGDSVPGVGAYSPRYETSGARQISLNGCGRDSNQKGTDTPGPAEYQSISESQARGP